MSAVISRRPATFDHATLQAVADLRSAVRAEEGALRALVGLKSESETRRVQRVAAEAGVLREKKIRTLLSLLREDA